MQTTKGVPIQNENIGTFGSYQEKEIHEAY